ncbi:MAG: TolC family protein [Gammaproteobacteria bacterium]|nr:TolC family protein [Gammaproteobacteria bacterium]
MKHMTFVRSIRRLAPARPPHGARTTVRLAAALALGALSGCALYHPLPLPTHDDLASALPTAGKAQAPTTKAAPQPAPLDMDEVATLAVLNNPDLNAARASLGVAEAQAFAAGILPNPQLSLSSDRPIDRVNSPSDPRYPEYHQYGIGLAVDLRALLTHHSQYEAASAQLRQAREDLLWQEWQTVAEARLLYTAQVLGRERSASLAPAAKTFATAAARSQTALAEGNLARDQADADQAAAVSIATQAGAAERAAAQAERALRALLGLRDSVQVPLAPLAAPPIPDRASVEAALRSLPARRPDLRALQAGYRSQEEQVRTAVLSQFPNIVLGFNRSRDFSDVHSLGGAVSFDLPLFDRGQGAIAIQRATRAQLRAEYQARLDQASAEVWQIWHEMRELKGELAALDARLPGLGRTLADAKTAYRAGNYPVAAYLALVNAYLGAESSHYDLLQNLWSDSIALATLTGTQIEPAAVHAT